MYGGVRSRSEDQPGDLDPKHLSPFCVLLDEIMFFMDEVIILSFS